MKAIGRVCRFDISVSKDFYDEEAVVYLHDHGHSSVPLTVTEARQLADMLAQAAEVGHQAAGRAKSV